LTAASRPSPAGGSSSDPAVLVLVVLVGQAFSEPDGGQVFQAELRS